MGQVVYHQGCTCILLSCAPRVVALMESQKFAAYRARRNVFRMGTALLRGTNVVLNTGMQIFVPFFFFFFAHSVQTGCLSQRVTFLFAHGNETMYGARLATIAKHLCCVPLKEVL